VQSKTLKWLEQDKEISKEQTTLQTLPQLQQVEILVEKEELQLNITI
jgi:hypothetical protein